MNSSVLEGVVAWVCCRTDGDNTVQSALIATLQELGAKAVTRMSKDVTHIIFRQALDPTEKAKSREDAELTQLFEKAYKVMPPPFIVSPLWVYSSREQGKRAMERQYALAKPNDNSLKHITKTPHSVRKSAGAALKAVTSLRKPRRRHVADAGLSPSPSDSVAVDHLPKRARTMYARPAERNVDDGAGTRTLGANTARQDVAAAVHSSSPSPVAVEIPNATSASPDEPDENFLSSAAAVIQPAEKTKCSGVLQPSSVANQVEPIPMHDTPKPAVGAQNVSLATPKTKGASIGKRRALAATAAGAIASVIDAAFGMVGSGKAGRGMSLRRGLLGAKRKTPRRGAALATAGHDGIESIVLTSPDNLVEEVDITDAAGEDAAAKPAMQVLELLENSTPTVQSAWPSGGSTAEANHASRNEGHPVTIIPATPPAGSQPQEVMNAAAEQGRDSHPNAAGFEHQWPVNMKQAERDAAQQDDGQGQSDSSSETDSEEDADVDALLNPCAPFANPPLPPHAAMPPRCPSPIPSSSPMQLPPGHPMSLPISMPSSPIAGRSSPGRIRQQWSIPPTVEARRSSNDCPAWKLRAEAALAEAAQAFEAHTNDTDMIAPPTANLPPMARSPSRRESPARRHTRSMSSSSLESNGDSPGKVKLALSEHHSSEDDMMLGGVPNIVAKNISPAGKLASPTTLGTKTRSRPGRKGQKAALTEEVSKALAVITVADAHEQKGATSPVGHSRSAARGGKAGDGSGGKGCAPRHNPPAAAGKQGTTGAVPGPRMKRSGEVQNRSTSVPPVRPAWGVHTVPAQDVAAGALKPTRVLRSTVSLPAKQVVAAIGSSLHQHKANKQGLSASQKLFTRVQYRTLGNRLAASAEGILQVSAVEAAKRTTKVKNKLLSIAEKTTAASRAKAASGQVIEAPSTSAKPATAPPVPAATNTSRQKLKYLAFTSLSGEMQQLVKSAVRRLPGLRMCIDGNEDGRLTHLVIGAERRTLKVLLAIANGAHLLSPAWASDSLAADEWLPEDQYPAETRFTKVAERVREMQASGRLVKPLEGHMVFIHVPTNAHGGDRAERPSERRHTLQRLVQALGGKVAPARACTLCIACEDVRRPKGMPEGVKMIRDEWLFLVAENYQQVGMAEHMIAEEEQ